MKKKMLYAILACRKMFFMVEDHLNFDIAMLSISSDASERWKVKWNALYNLWRRTEFALKDYHEFDSPLEEICFDHDIPKELLEKVLIESHRESIDIIE